ncbi:MAG: ankyrin repeat domain-containing protein [Granulosicoccus sp.]
MQKHWIDRDSESGNVIVCNDLGFFIGSCDKSAHDNVDQQFNAGKTPAEVLGTEDLTVIPYIQIQNLTSRSTDRYFDIGYKAKGSTESTDCYFEDESQAQECSAFIDQYMPDNLTKKVVQQSAISAGTNPLLSLLVCLGASYLFINKFHMPVYIIGGLWALISTVALVGRLKSPPVLTRWNIKGKHARKAWAGLKTVYAYTFVAVVAVGGSQQLPDSYGEKAISDRMAHEMIQPDDIKMLLGRGADINYLDDDGDTPLTMALYWEEEDMTLALIEAGASLTMKIEGDSSLEYALYNSASKNVIEAMLERGALNIAEKDGFDPMEFSIEYEKEDLIALFEKHRRVVQSGL